ncbi:hypothetical protein K0B03_02495 [Patescibacteria group bacterium]|nr:hypothetical protein [Patescibacteria group bacterium]
MNYEILFFEDALHLAGHLHNANAQAQINATQDARRPILRIKEFNASFSSS